MGESFGFGVGFALIAAAQFWWVVYGAVALAGLVMVLRGWRLAGALLLTGVALVAVLPWWQARLSATAMTRDFPAAEPLSAVPEAARFDILVIDDRMGDISGLLTALSGSGAVARIGLVDEIARDEDGVASGVLWQPGEDVVAITPYEGVPMVDQGRPWMDFVPDLAIVLIEPQADPQGSAARPLVNPPRILRHILIAPDDAGALSLSTSPRLWQGHSLLVRLPAFPYNPWHLQDVALIPVAAPVGALVGAICDAASECAAPSQ